MLQWAYSQGWGLREDRREWSQVSKILGGGDEAAYIPKNFRNI